MQSLLETQRDFAAGLMESRLDQPGQATTKRPIAEDRLFSIYANNVEASHENILSQIFPVIRLLVGDDFFGHLVRHYSAAFPSRSGDVSNFGQSLAQFLYGFGAVDHLPYLVDVARLEWAYHRVFHETAPNLGDRRSLDGVSGDRASELRFVLGSACRIIRSAFPVFEIWRMHSRDSEVDFTISLDQGAETVLVTRQGANVALHRLDAARAALLDDLRAGKRLGYALETAASYAPEENWPQITAAFIRSGLLVRSEDQKSHPTAIDQRDTHPSPTKRTSH